MIALTDIFLVDDTGADNFLDHRLQTEPFPDRLERFEDWLASNQELKTLMLSHQTDSSQNGEVVVGGKYKCCEPGCKHYVYGVETVEALRRHGGLHEEAEVAKRGGKRESRESIDAGACVEARRGCKGNVARDRNGNVAANGFGGKGAMGSPFPMTTSTTVLMPTHKAEQRLRLPAGSGSGVGGEGMSMAKTCLRCKVLKKKVCLVGLLHMGERLC